MLNMSLQNNNWFSIRRQAPQGVGFLWGEPLVGRYFCYWSPVVMNMLTLPPDGGSDEQ